MSDNILERAIVPYNPSSNRVVNNNQYNLYAPAAGVGKVGMAGYSQTDFDVSNSQTVSISNTFKGSVLQQVKIDDIPSNITYEGTDGIKTTGVMYNGYTREVVDVMMANDVPVYITVTGALLVALSDFTDADNYSVTEMFIADGRTWTRELDIIDGEVDEVTDFMPLGVEGEQGPVGPQGEAAGFGTPTISITQLLYNQSPTATITASGPDTAKIFAFAFRLPAGKPFSIKYIVEDVDELTSKTDAVVGDFAIVQSVIGALEEDNAKLYTCTVDGGSSWTYVSDLSGANGLSLLRTDETLKTYGTDYIQTSALSGTPMIGDTILDTNGTMVSITDVDDDVVAYEFFCSIIGPQGPTGSQGPIGPDGKRVYIKYSAYSDGTAFTDVWNSSQAYIGVAVASEAPEDKEDYEWSQFVGNYVETLADVSSTVINYTLPNNTDKTYMANNITAVNITVPNTMHHGFYTGINLKSSATPPSVSFVNNSIFPLKIMQFGVNITSYTPAPNCTVSMSIFCDGINVYCYINEV